MRTGRSKRARKQKKIENRTGFELYKRKQFDKKENERIRKGRAIKSEWEERRTY